MPRLCKSAADIPCEKCNAPMHGIKDRAMRSICAKCLGVSSPYYDAKTRRARLRIDGVLPKEEK